MAMTKEQLLKWVEGLDDQEEVGIDDGGLCLRVVGGGCCLELGGIPEEVDAYTPECECQNCGERFYLCELMPIEDYAQRVEQGEPEPAGQCPSCGALCHEVDDKPEDVLCAGCGKWIRSDESSIELDGSEYHVACDPQDDKRCPNCGCYEPGKHNPGCTVWGR